jgi:hypothetical protein
LLRHGLQRKQKNEGIYSHREQCDLINLINLHNYGSDTQTHSVAYPCVGDVVPVRVAHQTPRHIPARATQTLTYGDRKCLIHKQTQEGGDIHHSIKGLTSRDKRGTEEKEHTYTHNTV